MFQKFFDIRTLTFVLMLMTMFLSAAMIFVWRKHKTYAGFGYWAISNLTAAVGFLLIALRGALPDFLTILTANTLILGSFLLSFEGIRRFRGLANRKFFSFGILLLQAPLLGYFTYSDNRVIPRIIVVSVINAAVCLLCAYELLRNVAKEILSAYRQVGLIFALFAVVSIARAVFTYLYSDMGDLFAPDWIQSLAFVATILFTIAWSFCYIILNTERTQQELQATQIEFERIAATDFLTGIGNSRRFFEISKNEVGRAIRFRNALSVIIFDIDHFKKVNDTYGHAAGDQVLVKIAEIGKKVLRNSDTFGRLGGEEFAVLLPHTNMIDGITVAEHLRQEIEKTETEFGAETIKITASFGVSEIKNNETEIKTALDRADGSLYEAKRNGRNQVIGNF